MKYLLFSVTLNLIFFTNIVSSLVTINPSYNEDTPKTKKVKLGVAWELMCNVTANEEYHIRWEKEGEGIAEIKRLKDRTHTGKRNNGMEHTLKIDKGQEEDAGNYSCIAHRGDIELAKGTIMVKTYPKIKIPESVNVVEGEKLRIHCIVTGNPTPTISWHVINETISMSTDRIQLLEDQEKQIPNAILQVEDVEMSDRGEYICIAYSEEIKETLEGRTKVRIKDKYAALWPFLGICAEVFVLCAIILIYEKKRNKTELEESDTDQSPDQKNTPDHGKESNLRHRQ